MNKLVNGEPVPMTPEEIAAWEAGQVESPPTPVTEQIKALVTAMPPAVLIRYAGDAALIGQFLNEGNLMGAAGLLQVLAAKMAAANDTEALAAAQPVLALM